MLGQPELTELRGESGLAHDGIESGVHSNCQEFKTAILVRLFEPYKSVIHLTQGEVNQGQFEW